MLTNHPNLLGRAQAPINGGGTGDVVGPASSTDNAIARWDGTTGKLLQNSTATIDDSGNLAVAGANAAVGGAINTGVGLRVISSTLSSITQIGISSSPTGTSAGTSALYGGYFALTSAAAAYTISSVVNLFADSAVVGSGSAITTHRGLFIANLGQAGVTHAYGVDITAQSGAATTNVGLRNAGTTLLTNTAEATSAGGGSLQCAGGAAFAKAVLCTTLVSAKTQAASPYSVLTTEARTLFTNEGTTGGVVFTLPSAAANLQYTFYVADADGITITAASGDDIRIAVDVTATAGSISSAIIGSSIRLVAINATNWVATATTGTWTI